jgi:hypothetical protein
VARPKVRAPSTLVGSARIWVRSMLPKPRRSGHPSSPDTLSRACRAKAMMGWSLSRADSLARRQSCNASWPRAWPDSPAPKHRRTGSCLAARIQHLGRLVACAAGRTIAAMQAPRIGTLGWRAGNGINRIRGAHFTRQ